MVIFIKKGIRLFFLIFYTALFIFPLNSSDTERPPRTFVLVHGAWHGSWCYYELADRLKEEGHKVILVQLPGHGIDQTNEAEVTLYDYQAAIVEILDDIEEQVILVGHSMGGVAISMAAEARPYKIEKLVYLAAFLVPDGKSLLDMAQQDPGSRVLPNLIVKEPEGIIDIKRDELALMFYNECNSQYIELARTLIRPNPLAPFVTPVSLSENNYETVRRFYIKTALDHAVTPELQDRMILELPCEKVYTIISDHSAFFSKVNKLKKILCKIANK